MYRGIVWNAQRAERVRVDCAAKLREMITLMEETVQAFLDEAERLDGEAETEERVAATARRLEVRVSTSGERISSFVADTEKREAAASKAASYREQARLLRLEAENITAAIEQLEETIERTNGIFFNMHRALQSADERSAKLLSDLGGDIGAYIGMIMGIHDSFSDSFPVPAGAGMTPFSASARASKIMSAAEAAALMGRRIQCALGGDPVNMSTGNFVYSKEDIAVPGRHPLAFERFYNSIGGTAGVLGHGWTQNYNIRLRAEEEYAYIAFGDGHVETYQSIGEGRYVAPLDSRNTLRRTEDGWMLVNQKADTYLFNDDGLLLSIADINDSRTAFEYDGKLLAKASTESGSLSFSYDKFGHLISTTDHTGRTVKYEYDGNKLISAMHPNGTQYRCGYDNQGLLSEITNPLGVVTLRNEYDENCRMVKQCFPDGGSMEYSYEEKRTVFVQQNGGRVIYERDDKYRTTGIEYEDGTERYEYDNRSLRTLAVDKLGGTTRYEYDLAGNVTCVTNALGIKAELEYTRFNQLKSVKVDGIEKACSHYDDEGSLIAMDDAVKNRTEFAYTHKGIPDRITQADGSEIHFTYDRHGNIEKITSPDGAIVKYSYDMLNRVVATVDGNGNEAKYEYDTAGKIVAVTDAQGNVRRYRYNKSGKVTEITDFDGGTVKYRYNDIGKVEEVEDPAGGITKLGYDLMWNVTEVTDPCGNTVSYEYDKHGRVIRTIDGEGNATSYEHDPLGNVIAVISPAGARTELKYDALGRRMEVTEPDGAVTKLKHDSFGNVVQVTDALGNVTKRKYDPADRLIKLTDPLKNETKISYTPLGQIESVTDAKGGVRRYDYYPGGRLKSVTLPCGESETYEYDKNGNIVRVTDALGNVTKLIYGSLNRVTETINPLGYGKKFEYDAAGNITSMTDEKGNVTRYKYSALGNIIDVIDAMGHSTRYDYDKAGRMTRFEQYRLIDDTLANTHHQEVQITTYERDKRGNIIAVTSPLGDVVKYGYDKASNVTSKLDEDGFETLYEYNLANKLTKVCYADGKTVELSYNPLKQLTGMKDRLGITRIETDGLGRTVKVTDYEGNEVGYAWNELSQREALTYPDGSEVKYGYNESGRLSEVLSESGITNYAYDLMGRLTQRVLPDGTETTYDRDPLGRLKSLTHGRGGDMLDVFRYTYDPAGNITRIEKRRKGMEADSGIFEYGYDPLSRLTTAARNGQVKHYSYDSLGNRVSEHIDGTNRKEHTFNARNQLVSTIDGVVTTQYGYDRRGNLTQITEDGQLKQQFAFDATNMMTDAFTAGKGSAEYTYNGFRARVRKLETFHDSAALPDPEREMRYVLDMTKPFDNLLMTQGAQNQSFVWGSSLLEATGDTAADSFYYLHDHLGSPVRLLGADGNDEPLAYDEFGVPLVGTQNLHQPFGFTGYQTEDIPGLYYAQARYYEPQAGRFAAQDTHWHPGNMIYGDMWYPSLQNIFIPEPMAIRQSSNLYAYTLSNPIKYVDPDGESATPATIIALGIAIFGGGVKAYDRGKTTWEETGCWRATASSAIGGFVEGGISTGLGVATQVALGLNPDIVSRVVVGSLTQPAYNAFGTITGYGVERFWDGLLGVEWDMNLRSQELGNDIVAGLASGFVLGGTLDAFIPRPLSKVFGEMGSGLLGGTIDVLIIHGYEQLLETTFSGANTTDFSNEQIENLKK